MDPQQNNHNNEDIDTENTERMRHRRLMDSNTNTSNTNTATNNTTDSNSIYTLGGAIYSTISGHTQTARQHTCKYIHKCIQNIREWMRNIQNLSITTGGSQNIPPHIPCNILYAIAHRALPDIALAIAVHQICVILGMASVANAAAVIVNVMSFVLPVINTVYLGYISVNSMARVSGSGDLRSNETASNNSLNASAQKMIMIRNIPMLITTLMWIFTMYKSIGNNTQRNIGNSTGNRDTESTHTNNNTYYVKVDEPVWIGVMAMMCICSQCIVVIGGDVSKITAVGVFLCTVLSIAGMGMIKGRTNSNSPISRFVTNAGTIGKCIIMISGIVMIMIVKYNMRISV
ncbi:hypothetical protein CWI41_020030 [Ordospora colligata]|nr:hypothetical protein CWI41_020030 [Ordospora colligata]